jgi:hypothetical protein
MKSDNSWRSETREHQVRISPDGVLKLLDFRLAEASEYPAARFRRCERARPSEHPGYENPLFRLTSEPTFWRSARCCMKCILANPRFRQRRRFRFWRLSRVPSSTGALYLEQLQPESASCSGAVWRAIAGRDSQDIGQGRIVIDMPVRVRGYWRSHLPLHRCGRLVAHRAAARVSSLRPQPPLSALVYLSGNWTSYDGDWVYFRWSARQREHCRPRF